MSIPEAYQKIFKVQTVPVVQDTDFAEFEDKNEKEQKVPRFRLVELKVPPIVAYFEESAHNVDLKDCKSRKNIVLCQRTVVTPNKTTQKFSEKKANKASFLNKGTLCLICKF